MPSLAHTPCGYEGRGGLEMTLGENTREQLAEEAYAPPNIPMNPGAISETGGGQARETMASFQDVNLIICLKGTFPLQPQVDSIRFFRRRLGETSLCVLVLVISSSCHDSGHEAPMIRRKPSSFAL